jgi:hypothetical protein
MLREFIERAAYNKLRATYPDKAAQVRRLILNGETPLMIAEWLGNRQVIHGSVILLAASYVFNSGEK